MPDIPNSSAEFFEALGLAVVQWSKVEDAYCDLFIRLTACSMTGRGMTLGRGDGAEGITSDGIFMLGNIFYSTTNFRGRLELLTHMVERLIPDPELLAEWSAIKNKAGKLYQRRNVLAHGAPWSGDHGVLETMRYSIFSLQDAKMDYGQIKQAAQSFHDYSERIEWFAINANKLLSSRKRFPEDFPDQAGVD